MALGEKRGILETVINQYYEGMDKLFSVTVSNAATEAVNALNEIINKSQDAEIKKLKADIQKINASMINSGSLLDIAIAIFAGPLFGNVLQLGLKKIPDFIIGNRKSIVEASHVIDGINKDWSKIKPEQYTSAIVKKIDDILIIPADKAPPIISKEQWLDFFTGFANDASQEVFNKINSSESKTPDLAKQAYTNPVKISDIPITDMLSQINDYVAVQTQTNYEYKYFHLENKDINTDEDKITAKITNFKDRVLSLPKFSDKSIKDYLRQGFEAILWISFLGDPVNWAAASGGGFYHKEHELQYSSVEAEVEYVFTFRYFIPTVIWDYLLKRMKVEDSTESFLDHYTKEKQNKLGRTTGYGIDKRDSAVEDFNYRQLRYPDQMIPEKPVSDPESIDYTGYNYAGKMMQDWFIKVNKQLIDEQKYFNEFLAKKRITPVR